MWMATSKQRTAAKRNIKKAQAASKSKRTISHLPKATRQDLGRQASAARRRGGRAGHALEERTRPQLYEEAKKLNIPGRSSMGKWELIEAIRRHS
jgi:Rho termination factor, N-terminal domain